MFERGTQLRSVELGITEETARELADTSKRGIAARRNGWTGEAMKKKTESTEMQAVRQRHYPNSIFDESNAIPRSTEFDLKPVQSRTHSGFDECAFEAPKPGNALWEEKNRP